MTSRASPYFVNEIVSLLLAQESRFEKNSKVTDVTTMSTGNGATVSANVAQEKGNGGRNFNGTYNNI